MHVMTVNHTDDFASSYHHQFPSWGLVITGGKIRTATGSSRATDTVESIVDGENVAALQSLPGFRYGHCATIIDDNRIFVAGKEDDGKKIGFPLIGNLL